MAGCASIVGDDEMMSHRVIIRCTHRRTCSFCLSAESRVSRESRELADDGSTAK